MILGVTKNGITSNDSVRRVLDCVALLVFAGRIRNSPLKGG